VWNKMFSLANLNHVIPVIFGFEFISNFIHTIYINYIHNIRTNTIYVNYKYYNKYNLYKLQWRNQGGKTRANN